MSKYHCPCCGGFHEERFSMPPGLSLYDYNALIEWMKDPNRKEAIIAFTAGAARDAARAFEEYLREVVK